MRWPVRHGARCWRLEFGGPVGEIRLFSGVDRNRPGFFVFREQALVQVAAVEVQAWRRQPEETYFAVDQVGRHVQRVVAVEGDQRRLVDVRVVHFEQRGDALVNAAAAGVELFELAYPFAAFADRLGVGIAPVRIGDTVRARATISAIDQERGRVTVETARPSRRA